MSAATLAEYRNRHAGETIVVCGCGPSLRDLDHPAECVTIGVNDVGRLFDPTYLVVLNPPSQFAPGRFEHVRHARAKALFTQLDLGPVGPPVVRFALGQRGGTGDGGGRVLHYTQNSPYVAVGLAAWMGARRIELIGVDFVDDHFFGQTGPHRLAPRLRDVDAEYARLAEALRGRGIELVNLSAVSRLTSLPKCSLGTFGTARIAPLSIVSYATTPVAGVPEMLARCIRARTQHRAVCIWPSGDYGNGVRFEGGVAWQADPVAAAEALEAADLVIAHNGRIAPGHRRLVAAKPVITMAHNYGWNVDMRFVAAGGEGVVVGQYQALLPEFAGWSVVANPLPFWEEPLRPGPKPEVVTVVFTPSAWHERYPLRHRLYWHAKGAETTLRTLEDLARRRGIRFETTRARQVAHTESLAMKCRAHVVIDEAVTGSYHRNSLEGLAAGAVTLNGLGQLVGVEEALRRCSGDDGPDPFVRATLETLPEVLEELVESGPEALAERGRAGRCWLERHWRFEDQWVRLWMPVVERALARHRGSSRPKLDAPAEAETSTAFTKPTAATAQSVSAVVPFGGADRLPLLDAAIAGLAAQEGVAEVIIAELGAAPLARDVAKRHGALHLFDASAPPFHKAGALTMGSAAARAPWLLWFDADLLAPPGFVLEAVAEAEQCALDCLVPWTSVEYLSDPASADVLARRTRVEAARTVAAFHTRRGARGGAILVRRAFFQKEGGPCEAFRGWGGEDDAWFWKARVLGRAAITTAVGRRLWHLYHALSGGSGGSAHRDSNPLYAQNLALLTEMRRLGTREAFLARFPRPAVAASALPACVTVTFEAEPGKATLFDAAAEAFGVGAGSRPNVERRPRGLEVVISREGRPTATLCVRISGPERAVIETPNGECLVKAARDRLGAELGWRLLSAVSLSLADAPGFPDHFAPDLARPPMTKLNLGCCDRLLPGYVNVDSHGGPGVQVADLREPWPWDDGTVEAILAQDIIEHLPDKIHTMNEIYRVLRPGGRAEIAVPTTDGPGAFQDPTHVSFWNRRSFLYYEDGNPYRERFAERYGIGARFSTVAERIEPTPDGPRLTIVLEAVKL